MSARNVSRKSARGEMMVKVFTVLIMAIIVALILAIIVGQNDRWFR